ncbi:MAG: DUF1015 family protein [Acidimicrobiales bacterium]
MPTFRPFDGVRYAESAARLDEVIAPPYDVVGPEERDDLSRRNPLNAIRLELPEPDPATGRDRYQAAAHLLSMWLERADVVADREPAFYPYRMTTPDGTVTTGVIGALTIGDDVLPHEETMAKVRSDRLDLLRVTGANLSPIWGLSLTNGLTATFAPSGPPASRATDDEGVLHELWVLDDPATASKVSAAVADSPVVVADGHHRYETARTYRAEVRAANGDRAGDHDAVMALVVELSEEQLHVRAIHRLVDGLPEGTDLREVLGPYFDAVNAGPSDDSVLRALDAAGSLALVTPEAAWLLVVRPGAFEEAGTDLVAGLVDLALRDVAGVSLSYTARAHEILSALRGGQAQAGILLQPVTVSQISSWAAARRRMPAKTTFFVPKPRTGMVYRLLSAPAPS